MAKRDSFSREEKERMLLPKETKKIGLCITGIYYVPLYLQLSFVEMVRFILTIPGVTSFLRPLENVFGSRDREGEPMRIHL